jgi:hypothetical protein
MSDGYPHHLAGPPASAPQPVEGRLLGMALKAHARHLAAVEHELVAAAGWPTNPRPARSLKVLQAEADAFDPHRAEASDGMIGDARHQAENGPHGPGSGSDHNPWVRDAAGVGVVRAEDITNDPALALADVAERIRARAAAGTLPQVTGGGYVILNGRITAEDFTGWRAYTGSDPHVSHMHVSTSLQQGQYDLETPWGVFSSEHPAPAPPAPPAPAPAGFTGPDLTGVGGSLRGDQGDNGPRVRDLQRFLNRYAPAYSALAEDGWWGPKTSSVLAEFGHRSSIPEADGRNIGPKLAAALYRAGLFRPLSAARDRVLRHVTRGARR